MLKTNHLKGFKFNKETIYKGVGRIWKTTKGSAKSWAGTTLSPEEERGGEEFPEQVDVECSVGKQSLPPQIMPLEILIFQRWLFSRNKIQEKPLIFSLTY